MYPLIFLRRDQDKVYGATPTLTLLPSLHSSSRTIVIMPIAPKGVLDIIGVSPALDHYNNLSKYMSIRENQAKPEQSIDDELRGSPNIDTLPTTETTSTL